MACTLVHTRLEFTSLDISAEFREKDILQNKENYLVIVVIVITAHVKFKWKKKISVFRILPWYV